MIKIKDKEFADDFFKNIDEIHAKSKALYSTLPQEALDLLKRTREEVTNINKESPQAPKLS